MSNHPATFIQPFTIIFAIRKNEVIEIIKSIFLNIKQISSFFMLISTSSFSPSIFLITTLFLPHLAYHLFNEVIKSIKPIFVKMIPFDSIFVADVNGIIFNFEFCYNNLLF